MMRSGGVPSRSARARRGHKRRFSARALAVATLLALAQPAAAVQPDEVLADSVLEARARALSAGLRCLVCQNQSIDDSNAPLARDLRVLVRERLKAGDSDAAVRTYVVQRYGEFVLLRPPVSPGTLLLWIAPVLLLVTAGVLAARHIRGRNTQQAVREAEAPLSPEEAKRLEDILKKSG